MGVTGAMLAKRGFTGIPDILEAPYGGFLSTLSGEPDLTWLTRGLGEAWEIRKVGFKPYATAASIHSPLGLLDALMRENDLAAGDIERIVVHCSAMAHRHCAWPYRPAGVTAAQMNMPFALAMMAVDRAAMGAQFREERLADPKVLTMLDRIVVEPAEEYSKGGDETRHAARVMVVTKSGRTFKRETWNRPGSPGQSHDGGAAAGEVFRSGAIRPVRRTDRKTRRRHQAAGHACFARAVAALDPAIMRPKEVRWLAPAPRQGGTRS